MFFCNTTKDSAEDFRFFNQNIVGHCAGCGVHIEHAVGVVPGLHGGSCRRCHQLALAGGTWSPVDGGLRCADNALDCCTWVAHRSLSRTRTKPLLCECRHTHQCNEHGEAMVYRAKGTVKDMEFIQFHPTALYHPGDRPAFLITEAMRGYGGVLRNLAGEEFMHKYDPRLSLAPRDVVARAIDSEMKQRGEDHVFLDVTHKDPEETKHHFPNIYKHCLDLGIDITKDYIPVVPAAHYLCGGIKVDLNACSSIERLYAVGECSCTGLHGGNRLASNSLIEAVVYAEAAAKHAIACRNHYDYRTDIPAWDDKGTQHPEEMVLISQSEKEVGEIMSAYVGIVRSNLRLDRAWNRLDILYEETEKLFKESTVSRRICELRNIINVGYLIMRQAKERKESRGLHYTVDYPPKPKSEDDLKL